MRESWPGVGWTESLQETGLALGVVIEIAISIWVGRVTGVSTVSVTRAVIEVGPEWLAEVGLVPEA